MGAIRYCKQLSKSDCGPIAIINTLKWAGIPVTLRKHLPYLNRRCLLEDYGTPIYRFIAVFAGLSKKRFTFKYRKKPKLQEIEKHIRNGGSAVLFYSTGENYHFALIISVNKTGSRFLMVNEAQDKTTSFVSRKTLKRFTRTGEPAVWLVNRYSIGGNTKET